MRNLLFSLLLSLLLAGCSAAPGAPDEPLQDRYWRAVEIDGAPVDKTSGGEPHVVLDQALRTHGSDGCNRFTGSYRLDDGLHFGLLASTMMACPPPVHLQSRAFVQALSATAAYRIRGRQMELLDRQGKTRLRLEATFLK